MLPVVRCQNCASKFTTDLKLAQHLGHKKDCEAYYDVQSDRNFHANNSNDDAPTNDDPMDGGLPSPSLLPTNTDFLNLIPNIRRSPSVSLEDTEDGDQVDLVNVTQRFVRSYPRLQRAGEALAEGATQFEKLHEQREKAGLGHWAPFESQHEYELAEWLLRNVNQRATEEFLRLPIVCPLHILLQRAYSRR